MDVQRGPGRSPGGVGEHVRSGRSWLRLLVGVGVLFGVLWAVGALDTSGRWGVLALAVVALAAIGVEGLLYRTPWSEVLRRLGFGRPSGRSLLLAAALSAAVLLVYPLSAAVSGTTMPLRVDWPWLLLGLYAFHGLAEELVWRGFVFRRLRAGRTFWSATLATMPVIAVTHLPIVFTMGPAVGLGAMAVAAVTSIPLGHLFETGRGTIWAPALLHTAIDGFKLVVIPVAALSSFPLLLIAISILVSLAVLAARLATPVPAAGAGPRPHSARTSR